MMTPKAKIILICALLAAVIFGGSLLYSHISEATGMNRRELQLAASSHPVTFTPAAETGGSTPERQPEAKIPDRIPAPGFTVHDVGDNSVRLSDFRGKPVVLNFWASWCPPCREEMPDFDLVYLEMGGDVQFMMVCMVDGARETKASGAAYIIDRGFSFPVFFDTAREAAITYGIRSIPTSLFIDSEGNVAAVVEGMINEATLRSGIELVTPETVQTAAQSAQYRKISPDEAKRMMDEGKEYILIDVRSESEYSSGHIDCAVLIPGDEIAGRAAAELPDKNALILIYCRSGARSKAAANALVDLGYTNVYDFGGINNWTYRVVR